SRRPVPAGRSAVARLEASPAHRARGHARVADEALAGRDRRAGRETGEGEQAVHAGAAFAEVLGANLEAEPERLAGVDALGQGQGSVEAAAGRLGHVTVLVAQRAR